MRILGYDYGKYRRQVDEKKFPLVPVITLVLNLSNTRWNDYKSLAEITNIPPEFEPYFQDYKVKVVDVAFLEDSVIEKFTSDFKLVAKFFKNRRLRVEEWGDKTRIKHVEAFLDFIAAFANDSRYQNIKEDLEKIKTKGENVDMDPYYDILIGSKIKKGEDKMAKLMEYLLANGTREEMQRAVSDETARAEMYERYGIEEAIKTDKKEEGVSA